jgi:RNA polymerase sigma-70 factor (ECF subfamily)
MQFNRLPKYSKVVLHLMSKISFRSLTQMAMNRLGTVIDKNNNIHEWVKAAMAGEEQAWNVLYQRYYPGLYATAIQLCGDFSEAKDLVQDSFVTAWLKISQLKDAVTFGSWIKTILIRNCYHWRNKNKQRRQVDVNNIVDDRLMEYEFEKKLDHLLIEDRLFTALTRLPEILRSTLLLRYFSAFQSYHEISEILSVPVGTIRSRLNEAKSKLIEKWNQPPELEVNVMKESSEWNEFYYQAYSGLHFHDDQKNKLLDHLDRSVQIVLPGGESNIGSRVFENIIADDRRVGSYLTPVNVVSSGNISVIEVKHHNSAEFPHHCPPRSVTVLFRKKEEVNKMNLHFSWD